MGASDSSLKRAQNPMLGFVREALEQHGLVQAFDRRPAYQRNDYLGWIARAKRAETQLKRLSQMLDELERGGVYMNMDHPASAKEV